MIFEENVMSQNPILPKIEGYVRELFKKRSAAENLYHNIIHTSEVVNVASRIAHEEELSDQDTEIILIAAWFHDTGYFHCCNGHEDQSSEYARDYLEKEKYPIEKIAKVLDCIKATRIPHSPKNKLEEIICDADLHHLGMKDIEARGELLRQEFEMKGIKKLSDIDWLSNSVDFFKKHKYFTDYAKREFGLQKNLNQFNMERKLKKLEKRSKEEKLSELKLEIEQKKIDHKHKTEKRSDRGVETMFRNIMRTHVEFSAMADSKANIMISVNTIMISIIVGFLLRFLNDNPNFIGPTIILTLTNLITLVYAILVTRPKVTAGVFTKEDVHNKKSNLLFFGNFYNMKLEDFSWGMKSLMEDQEYLYDSMIKDFYNLGQVLGVKYKHLRMCYTIFMYGLIISVVSFGIAFFSSPMAAY